MTSNAPSEPVFRELLRENAEDPSKPVRSDRAGFCSPKNFVRLALLFAALFFVAHLAGLREFTSVLNGTVGNVDSGWRTSVFLGTIYILSYLCFVLVGPILLIAAAMLKISERVFDASRTTKPSKAANDIQ
jgi:hypothetical protein